MEVAPQHEWTFERRDAKGALIDTGAAKGKFAFYGQTADGLFTAWLDGANFVGPERIWWYTVDEPAGKIDDPTWKSKIAVTYRSTDWHSPGQLDDYATIYCNSDVEAAILSRRQLQCDQGFWDMQILAALRAKYTGDAEKLAAIAEIVREAADVGTVKAMDAARDRLLGL